MLKHRGTEALKVILALMVILYSCMFFSCVILVCGQINLDMVN
jgi:hypothetical protein